MTNGQRLPSDRGAAGRRAALAALFSGGAVLALFGMASAQTVSPEDIVRKLTPQPQTRSARGVEVIPGNEEEKPSIDLHVSFEFDSAKLDTDGLLMLKRLGMALKDPRLDGYRFEIAGHTDAVGSDTYNQALSERRAAAVRDHLIFYYDIDAKRLIATGYGKTRLLDPSKPTDGINRRVQVTNVGK